MDPVTVGDILVLIGSFGCLVEAASDLFSHPADHYRTFLKVIVGTVGLAVIGMCVLWATSQTSWFLLVGGLTSLLGAVAEGYWLDKNRADEGLTKRQRQKRRKSLASPSSLALKAGFLASICLGSLLILVS